MGSIAWAEAFSHLYSFLSERFDIKAVILRNAAGVEFRNIVQK